MLPRIELNLLEQEVILAGPIKGNADTQSSIHTNIILWLWLVYCGIHVFRCIVGSMYLGEYGCRKCTNSQENNGKGKTVRLSMILMTCILNEDRCMLATHFPASKHSSYILFHIYNHITRLLNEASYHHACSTSVNLLTNNFQIARRKQN